MPRQGPLFTTGGILRDELNEGVLESCTSELIVYSLVSCIFQSTEDFCINKCIV